MSKLTPKIVPGDWNAVAFAIAKLDSKLNTGATPTFADLTLSSPSSLYSLSHDSFADFVATEHLDHVLTQDANLQIWVRGYLTGTSPIDLGAGGNTWVKNGDATNTDAGVIGPALTFDGTGDWFNVATPTGMPTGTSDRTIFCRIKKANIDLGIPFAYGDTGNGKNMTLHARADGKFVVSVTGGNVFSTSAVLNNLKWHTIAVTFSGTDTHAGDAGDIRNALLYVDGIFTANSSSVEEIIDTQDTKLYIGANYDESTPFTGEIDDIRVYSRVLNADEILELHQLGTLDAMTTFDAAYFKKYIASRSGYFNNLNVSGIMNDVTMTGLTVTGGRDIDINASNFVGVGNIIPEDDITQFLGSLTRTWDILFVNEIHLENNSFIGIPGPDNPSITFDSSNNFIEIMGGNVGIETATPTAKLHIDQNSSLGARPVLRLNQRDIDDTFIDFIGTSAANGTRSISSDTTEDSAKFGAIRVEINGVTKWIRIYDNES